jgi:hypothetical protein
VSVFAAPQDCLAEEASEHCCSAPAAVQAALAPESGPEPEQARLALEPRDGAR